jgi:hypothetical protein
LILLDQRIDQELYSLCRPGTDGDGVASVITSGFRKRAYEPSRRPGAVEPAGYWSRYSVEEH